MIKTVETPIKVENSDQTVKTEGSPVASDEKMVVNE
jgi:hypothetical protein